jgi:hypothetical protein
MAKRGTKEWKDKISAANRKHGDATHTHRASEYRIWSLMIQRCNTPSNPAYRIYGARGIKVCRRWLSYENFLKDMGRRPSTKHTLERRDNDKGYTPSNCSWAPRKTQQRNMRRNRRITLHGKTQCLAAWSEELGIPRQTIANRLDRGWSVEKALTPHESSTTNKS